jgi:LCP family protein required for cell wall assembly
MGEWPDDWFRDRPGADDAGADNGRADKTVSIPSPQNPGGQYPAGQHPAGQNPAGQYPAGQYGAGRAAGGQGTGGSGRAGQPATSPGNQPATPPGNQPATPPGNWPAQPPLNSARDYGSPGYGSASGHGRAAGYGPGGHGIGGQPVGGVPGSRQPAGGLTAPVRSPARGGGPGLPGVPRMRRWLQPRRIFGVLALVIALILAGTVGAYFYLNSKLTRSSILLNYPGRPSPGVGTNWLIAGSDSRQGLTTAQERAYSTGYVAGAGRSDTIMILHIPAGGGGKPVLISVPRDSYVDIPGHGMDKINAAFSIGGPALLAETIQNDTGLYINHYMDIGFGGFVNVVNAVGGVRMCVTQSLYDKASGVHLTKGCQILSGGEALAYVRDRHSFATQDLQREQDQRIFLKALLTKMTSPGVMFNPFASLPAASGAASNLTVDQGTSLYQLVEVAMALRSPLTTTVPIADANYSTPAGDAVLWSSSQAKELFGALQSGQTVPKALITGSQLGS